MLSYNGVSLAYTNTLTVSQGPERDPSGTDTLFFATRIRVKAVVAANINPATGGETPPVTAARITHLLCSPRRPLLFAPDGTNYLVNLPGGLDDANGPEPDLDAFSIQEITPGSYAVTFAVTVRQTLCAQSSIRPYLSLRWSEVTETDANWLQVKRRAGLLICSSRGTVGPDDLRGLVTPGIYGGFRRESADYQLDESGLRLRFAFVDRQLADAVPYPLLDFDGQMSEIVTNGGVTRKGDFRLRATSAPGVSKRAMLNTVLMMAMSRVYATNAVQTKAGAILLGGSIGERLSTRENAIDVHLTWDILPNPAREAPSSNGSSFGALGGALGGLFGGPIGAAFGAGFGSGYGGAIDSSVQPQAAVGVFAQWMGQPFPFTDPQRGIAPPTRGLAPWVSLAAAVLNDPCGQTAVLQSSGGDSVLVGTTAGGTTVTASVVPTVQAPDEESLYSGDAAGGVWQRYDVELAYVDDTGRRVMSSTMPDTDNAVVRVSSRSLMLRAEFHLVRLGGLPTLPEFEELKDPNWVYLRGTTVPGAVTTAADGFTPVFKCSGVWEFAALNTAKALAGFHYPIPPFLQKTLVRQATRANGSGNGGGSGSTGGTAAGPGGGGFGPGASGGTPGGTVRPFGTSEGPGANGMESAVNGIYLPPFVSLLGVEGEVATIVGAASAIVGP